MSEAVGAKVATVMRALKADQSFPREAVEPAQVVLTELFSISDSLRSIDASLRRLADETASAPR